MDFASVGAAAAELESNLAKVLAVAADADAAADASDTQSATAGARALVGARVRVVRGRHFREFTGGDAGVVVRADAESGTCDVAFDRHEGAPLPVSLRHLEVVSPLPLRGVLHGATGLAPRNLDAGAAAPDERPPQSPPQADNGGNGGCYNGYAASVRACASATSVVEAVSMRTAIEDLRQLLLHETEHRVAGMRGLEERLEALRAERTAETERSLRTERRIEQQHKAELLSLQQALQRAKDQADLATTADQRLARLEECLRELEVESRSRREQYEEREHVGGLVHRLQAQLEEVAQSHAELVQSHSSLSRAPPDPRLEQQQMDLKARFDEFQAAQGIRLQQLGDEVRCKLDQMVGGGDETMTARIDALSRFHDSRLQQIKDEMSSKMSSVSSKLDESIHKHSSRLAEMEASTQAQLSAIREIAAPASTRIEELAQRVSLISSRLDESMHQHSSHLVEIEASSQAHLSAVRDIAMPTATRIDELANRVDELRRELVSRSELAPRQEQLDAMSQQIRDLEQSHAENVAIMRDRDSVVSAGLDSQHKSAIAVLREEVMMEIQAQITRVEALQRSGIQGAIAAADKRVSEVRQELSQAFQHQQSNALESTCANLSSRMTMLEHSASELSVKIGAQANEAVRVGLRASEALEAHCAAATEREKMLDLLRTRIESLTESVSMEAKLREDAVSWLQAQCQELHKLLSKGNDSCVQSPRDWSTTSLHISQPTTLQISHPTPCSPPMTPRDEPLTTSAIVVSASPASTTPRSAVRGARVDPPEWLSPLKRAITTPPRQKRACIVSAAPPSHELQTVATSANARVSRLEPSTARRLESAPIIAAGKSSKVEGPVVCVADRAAPHQAWLGIDLDHGGVPDVLVGVAGNGSSCAQQVGIANGKAVAATSSAMEPVAASEVTASAGSHAVRGTVRALSASSTRSASGAPAGCVASAASRQRSSSPLGALWSSASMSPRDATFGTQAALAGALYRTAAAANCAAVRGSSPLLAGSRAASDRPGFGSNARVTAPPRAPPSAASPLLCSSGASTAGSFGTWGVPVQCEVVSSRSPRLRRTSS